MPYHVQSRLNSFWYVYLESPGCLNFFILSLFLVKGAQALYVNPGCIKCISGINLSLLIKVVYYCIHFIVLKQVFKLLRIGTFIPVNLLNNPLASCSLINFGFWLSHTAHFDKDLFWKFLTPYPKVVSVHYLLKQSHQYLNLLKPLQLTLCVTQFRFC